MSLAELELSVRATNCLESEGITTVRHLVSRNEDQLLQRPQLRRDHPQGSPRQAPRDRPRPGHERARRNRQALKRMDLQAWREPHLECPRCVPEGSAHPAESNEPCVTRKPAGNSSGPRRTAGCSCATWPPRCSSTARSRPPWPRPRNSSRTSRSSSRWPGTAWNLNNFRRSLAVLTSKDVAFKLFHEIGPRFKDRPGGYTRIYKLAKVRQGDAAPMAVIALLGEDEPIKAPAPTRPAVVGARLDRSSKNGRERSGPGCVPPAPTIRGE